MSCKDLVDFLSEYLEGELPLHQRIVFASHLAMCPACRAYMATFKQTVALTKEAAQADDCSQMPEELIRAIQAARKAQATDRAG